MEEELDTDNINDNNSISDDEEDEYENNIDNTGNIHNGELFKDNHSKNDLQNSNNNLFEINTIKKFISSEYLDLDFNASYYNKRVIEVEKLPTLLTKDSNHGLTGLKNLGNTCYINTIIQCLSHSLELTYYFLAKLYVNEYRIITLRKD